MSRFTEADQLKRKRAIWFYITMFFAGCGFHEVGLHYIGGGAMTLSLLALFVIVIHAAAHD